jgi:hypothetical protein
MEDKGKIAKDAERYERAAHRVQSAIAFHPDRPRDQYKDLRTGLDLSKSDLGGLATLLIEKGLITKAEYIAAVADAAEREAEAKEHELSVRFGINVGTA